MKGIVYLIGAGPGDKDLITLKGLKYIKQADTIVYDRLANDALLEEAKDGCEFIYVGKKSSDHTKTQDEINDIICQKALDGKVVVRLKGGDPYVFGRGGEEGEYLVKRGIPFEVVPGVTSSIGGLAYAGIPITHRDYASSFHVITGHLKDDSEELNWQALTSLKGTLVFLMGVSNLEEIRDKLIENGKDKNTPAAIINWATRPNQRVVEGKLSNIYEKALEEKITPPSLIVVGEVVSLRKNLNFFEEKLLFGKKLIVTRSESQKKEFINKLEDLGAEVYDFPTIKINKIYPNPKLARAIENIEKYTHILLTSVNGVNIFFENLFSLGYDVRKLARLKVGAIGRKTAKAIESYGVRPDYIPEEYVSESFYKKLEKVLVQDDKVLIPRARNARPYLVEELSKICSVEEIKTYETIQNDIKKDGLEKFLEDEKDFYLTFTSPSTFNGFIKILGGSGKDILNKGKILSIGPVTSEAINKEGYTVYKEAREYTIEGLLDLLIKEGGKDEYIK